MSLKLCSRWVWSWLRLESDDRLKPALVPPFQTRESPSTCRNWTGVGNGITKYLIPTKSPLPDQTLSKSRRQSDKSRENSIRPNRIDFHLSCDAQQRARLRDHLLLATEESLWKNLSYEKSMAQKEPTVRKGMERYLLFKVQTWLTHFGREYTPPNFRRTVGVGCSQIKAAITHSAKSNRFSSLLWRTTTRPPSWPPSTGNWRVIVIESIIQKVNRTKRTNSDKRVGTLPVV